MDRSLLNRQMTAEQFAAFDTVLYLDTHPGDKVALKMLNDYTRAHGDLKKQFEQMFGPLTTDSGASGGEWAWVGDPWPWEKEAN